MAGQIAKLDRAPHASPRFLLLGGRRGGERERGGRGVAGRHACKEVRGEGVRGDGLGLSTARAWLGLGLG